MTTVRYNDKTKVWDVVDAADKNEKNIMLPNFLIQKLDKAKVDLKNDLDVTALCVGGVGSGKSTLMRLCCRYVSDEKFNPVEHIIQDAHDIKSVMKNAKPGDAILIDESSGIFSSADTLTKKTKYANLVLDVCRQKNLFIALAAPYFHRLGSSVAIDRSKFLLRVYMHRKTGKRGSMCYYSEKRKEQLYHFSKKNLGSIKGVRPNWRGEFGDDTTHKELYKAVKDKTLDKVLDSLDGPDEIKKKPKTEDEIAREYREKLVRKNMDKRSEDIAEILGVTSRTITTIKKKIRDEISEKELHMSVVGDSLSEKMETPAQYINTYEAISNHPQTTEVMEPDPFEINSKQDNVSFYQP